MNDCYPEKTTRIKSTDDPWITPAIKRRIRARKRIFQREKRSVYWKNYKKMINKMIKRSKKEYYDLFTNAAKKNNDPALYFKIISRLKDRQAPRPFCVTDLFRNLPIEDGCEEIADFFTKISDKFTPLLGGEESNIGSEEALQLNEKEVEERLKNVKNQKASSTETFSRT